MIRLRKVKKKQTGISNSRIKQIRGARPIVQSLVRAMENRKKEKTEVSGGATTNIILNNATIRGNDLLIRGKGFRGTEGEEDTDIVKRAPVSKGIDMAKVGQGGSFSFMPDEDNPHELENFKLSYPLIPLVPKADERVYAFARIEWDPKLKSLVYNIIEPPISAMDRKVIEDTKKELEERLDVNFVKIGEVKAKNLLKSEIRNILSEQQNLPPGKIDILEYYIERDVIGLGKIESLMQDADIEDISCDGTNVPIYVYHRDPKLNSLKTNVSFDDKEDLDMFVMKLSQKCGRSVSVSEPLVNGGLPDGSRVQATLGTDIAMKGSNFTIRKFTAMPLTPIHLVDKGTADSTMLAYLWLAIENRKSILISGGTATGKTSFLNALSLFLKPSLKVVSIEDTPELRLSHPHWVPEVARTPLSGEGSKIGEVSLFDLLKESLRQRPDYIIVGEVRGKEAYVLFQQIATGHSGLATIHAASLPQLIDRLVTPPISLPATLIENIDIIIFLTQVKIEKNYMRKVNEILEITGVEKERPVANTVFKWKSIGDKFESVNESKVMHDIAEMTAMKETEIINEIGRRKAVLEWMHDRKIYDYKEFTDLINQYYSNPEKLLARVDEGA
ncbi:MAG: type II/IV secretion system ATPase subunit [Candidatus Aenigmarchaeota archaeon]|nr:type II/IV secretion system ATPase subunit [Candidatus Aenigmarchaeota archaeon]